MLNSVRTVQKKDPLQKQIIYSIFSLVFGVCLGSFSKALDTAGFNELESVKKSL